MSGVSQPAEESVTRARAAADSVRAVFGRRLLGMPFTHLARVDHPVARPLLGPWHYWWQAHYLDALVDEALRESAPGGDPSRARAARTLAGRVLRTIRLRNVGAFPNHYYDDMAWLLLAAGRLDSLEPHRRRAATTAIRTLGRRLREGLTDELGGGVYWNDTHDFKNVPASAPAAIHWARTGHRGRAARVVDWLYGRLHDPDTGLFLDGIRIGPDGSLTTVRDVFTYNQGTVLGALVELGDPTSLRRAAALVEAVAARLTDPDRPTVLRAHGGGDGGLFTGIAVRYLALAARHPRMPTTTRRLAAGLVQGTADALWDGRSETARPRVLVFSPDPLQPASQTQPDGIPLELSTQLQAWMVFEAAAALDLGLTPTRTSPR